VFKVVGGLMREGGPADIAVTLEVHRSLDNGSIREVNEIWTRAYTGGAASVRPPGADPR
jgi:hypothetical protein